MSGSIHIAQADCVHIIRLVGDVRLNLCTAFDRYIREVLETSDKDCRNVLIDLSAAEGIDSTTLGQLARVSLLCQKQFDLKPTIYSPDSNITRLLKSMGFEQVFHILEESISDTLEFTEWVDSQVDEEAVKAHILAAHRALMDLNETNRLAFKELVEILENGDS